MAFKFGPIDFSAVAQGVGGFVFGSGRKSTEEDDSEVEVLLDRISNGVRAEDRQDAMAELQSVVAENRSAQLSIGTMGIPVLLGVFREDRTDIDMVRGALEILINACKTGVSVKIVNNQVEPGLVNSELFAQEPGSVALLLSLLEDDDFYVRYYTLQLLTALLASCLMRLQEAILATPLGITRLVDMMLEREVIRNEALIVLTFLTREAKEIQKIVVFEGAFERIFSIIKEEGFSDGGIIVQDCLELLNNLLRNNSSNQVILRETLGLQPVSLLLRLRKGSADGLTEQKRVNLLCALETVALLLARTFDTEAGKDPNITANQTAFSQNKLLELLVSLSVEARLSAVAIHVAALRCLGDLICYHSSNLEVLGSKIIGEGLDSEPALFCLLKLLLQAANFSAFAAADYVFKCFCEKNPKGQTMLLASIVEAASTSSLQRSMEITQEVKYIPFGSLLVQVLTSSRGPNQTFCRIGSVISHIVRDNRQCKEQLLQISTIKSPTSPPDTTELLLPRCLHYLAAATSSNLNNTPSDEEQGAAVWMQTSLLCLLITWVAECPLAVDTLLDVPSHLPFLVDLALNGGQSGSVDVAGLAAVLMGECLLYNTAVDSHKDATLVMEVMSQKMGLSMYFSKWEELKKSDSWVAATSPSHIPKPVTRLTAAAAVSGEGPCNISHDWKEGFSDMRREVSKASVAVFFDTSLVKIVRELEPLVRQCVIELFAHPKRKNGAKCFEFEQEEAESEAHYMARLKSLLQKQAREMKDLLAQNSALAENLLLRKTGEEGSCLADEGSEFSMLSGDDASRRKELQVLRLQLKEVKFREKAAGDKITAIVEEEENYKHLAAKHEAELQALAAAYNTLEQENYQLEKELNDLQRLLQEQGLPSVPEEQLRVAREEGQHEAEAEVNDLLVCLGQEQSKVERLKSRLEELGEDVDTILDGIGDERTGEEDSDD